MCVGHAASSDTHAADISRNGIFFRRLPGAGKIRDSCKLPRAAGESSADRTAFKPCFTPAARNLLFFLTALPRRIFRSRIGTESPSQLEPKQLGNISPPSRRAAFGVRCFSLLPAAPSLPMSTSAGKSKKLFLPASKFSLFSEDSPDFSCFLPLSCYNYPMERRSKY